MKQMACWVVLEVLGVVVGVPAADAPAFLRVEGFETPASLARWRARGVAAVLRHEGATQGKACAQITFKKYVPGGPVWPSFQLIGKGFAPTDWSGYSSLLLDIHNPGDTRQYVSLLLDNAPRGGKKVEWYRRYTLQPGSRKRIRVPLEEVAAKLDLKRMRRIMFYQHKPPRDSVLRLDDIRLVRREADGVLRTLARAERLLGALALPADDRRARAARDRLERLAREMAAGEISVPEAVRLGRRAAALERYVEGLCYRAPYAFDFGTEDSPVRRGFRRVGPKTRYTAEAGFGWRGAAGAVARAVPARREWTYSAYHRRKVPPRVYFNDLTQDCVGGDKPAEFRVDLPAGEYEVYLLAGFTANFPIRFVRYDILVGDRAPERISIPQRWIFEHRTWRVRVKKDGFSIRFRPQSGWVVNALLIYPVADTARARAEQIAAIEQEVYRLPAEMWANLERLPNPKPNPPPTPSAADARRGYILFSRGYVHNVYPDSAPSPDEVLGALSTFATPGEYEPVTFSIYPLRRLNGVRVRASALVSEKGRIGAESVDVRMVKVWFTRPQYANTTAYQQVPEMLVKPKPMDLAPRECRRFWITVKVPADAPPGLYRGYLEVTFAAASAARIPIRIEVLPFRLKDDPTKAFGMYYYDPRRHLGPKDSPAVRAAVEERARKECVDMREHGMNTVQLSGLRLKTIEKKKKYQLDFSALEANIRWYRSTGLLRRPSMLGFWVVQTPYRHFTGRGWPKHIRDIPLGPPEYYAVVTDLVRQLEAARRRHPEWPELYYYPIDEASNEAAPFLARMLQAIKEVPGTKTYVTQVFERASSRVIEKWVDVWCSAWFSEDREGVARARAKGQVFWCYPNFVACNRGVPNGARMTYGFAFWRSGYSCLIPWHYQAVCGNPFNDFDSTYGDWCCAYPGPDGPIPTQRWEAMREGIDDYRYIYTLQELLARAEKRQHSTRSVREAREYLKALHDRVPLRKTYVERRGKSLAECGLWTFGEYQAARRALADQILAVGREVGFND